MILAGIDASEEARSGSFIQKDSAVIHAHSKQEGLEIIPIKEALKKHDWVQEYYWKLVGVDTDKYTARARLELHNGYVIRALPGSKVVYPVQEPVYAAQGAVVRRVGCSTRPHGCDDLHDPAGVVERHHDIGEHEDHVGHVELFVLVPRDLLEAAGGLVAHEADRAT